MIKILENKKTIFFVLFIGILIRIIVNYILKLPYFVDVFAYEQAGFEFINKFRIEKNILMPLYGIVVYFNKKFLDLNSFNIIFSIINVYLVYLLTNKIFKDRSTANISALIMSVYPFNVFYALSGFSETFFITLVLAGFYYLFNKKFILSYIFFVLSILTRPTGELIYPFIILYFLIIIFKFNRNRIIINFSKYLAVYLILMAPWWYHNYIKYDKFVRLNLSTNYLLYVGNNKNNKSGGGVIIDEDDIRKFPERFSVVQSDYDYEIFKGKPGFKTIIDYVDDQGDVVTSTIGYGPGQVDPTLVEYIYKLQLKGLVKDKVIVARKKGLDNFFLRDVQFKDAALDFIKNNPKLFFKNAYIKFKRFWSPIPFTHEFRENLFFTSISFLSFSFLLFFSIMGVILHRNWLNLKLIPFYAIIIYTSLIHMVLISSIRYRFVIEWIMIITASYSIHFLIKKFFRFK